MVLEIILPFFTPSCHPTSLFSSGNDKSDVTEWSWFDVEFEAGQQKPDSGGDALHVRKLAMPVMQQLTKAGIGGGSTRHWDDKDHQKKLKNSCIPWQGCNSSNQCVVGTERSVMAGMSAMTFGK